VLFLCLCVSCLFYNTSSPDGPTYSFFPYSNNATTTDDTNAIIGIVVVELVVGEEETNAYSDDLNSTSSLPAAPPLERLELPDAEEGEELPDLPDPDFPAPDLPVPALPDPDLPDPLPLPLDDGRPLLRLLLPRADGRLLLTIRRDGADDGTKGVVSSANEEGTGDGVTGDGVGNGIATGDGLGTGFTTGD